MLLTDEEIKQLDCIWIHNAKWDEIEVYAPSVIDFARAIESTVLAKLREQNPIVGVVSLQHNVPCMVGADYYPASPPTKSVTLFKSLEQGTPLFEHPAPSAPKQEPFAWHSPTEGLSYENHYSDNQPLFEHPAPIPAEQIAEIKRKERERCAAVCERLISGDGICADNEVWIHDCAEAIRSLEDV